MNKNILLENLQLTDLEIYSDMHDIGAESGLEIVKELYLKHEGLRLYVPSLSSNKSLIERFITENKNKYSEHQLARFIGWRVDQVRFILYKRNKNNYS
ncbi:MAG: hypothetical protein NTW25_00475, partial [Candidatus Kapabacteria bacterium]|nr:hypothetical protein [Candidatus Kapabacteria bacterium]